MAKTPKAVIFSSDAEAGCIAFTQLYGLKATQFSIVVVEEEYHLCVSEAAREKVGRLRRQKETGLKHCPKCGEDKPVSEFWDKISTIDGLRVHCKVCMYEYNKPIMQAKRTIDRDNIPETKICSVCHQEKPASEFRKDGNYADGLLTHCRQCGIDLIKRHATNRREKGITATEKTCASCKRLLPADRFGGNWRNKTGLNSYCKTCIWLKRHALKKTETKSVFDLLDAIARRELVVTKRVPDN